MAEQMLASFIYDTTTDAAIEGVVIALGNPHLVPVHDSAPTGSSDITGHFRAS